MKIPRIAVIFFMLQFANTSQVLASEPVAECFGDSTVLYSNNDVTLSICHAPYTKIDRSLLGQWQDCDDAIVYLRDKAHGTTKEHVDCSPTTRKQFMVRGHTFMLRHFYTEYPGFESKPLVVETFDIHNKEKKYEIVAKLKTYNKKDIENAVAKIDSTITKPFDGKTYFTSIYGGFFKLRDYAVSDPDFVLSILNKYKKKGVFDGEVAETLSNVIDEVELIAKASG